MTWAQRLKRVSGIDIETCAACGGALRISACSEEPAAASAGAHERVLSSHSDPYANSDENGR